jgi:hypothetical protein
MPAKVGLVLATIAALSSLATPASADPQMQTGSPAVAPPPAPSELGRGTGQFFAGGLTLGAGLYLASAFGVFDDGALFLGAGYATLALTPAAVGGIVCLIGRYSPHYTGSCIWPMLGAYVGASASTLLLVAALATTCDSKSELDLSCAFPPLLAFTSYFFTVPLGSIIGWNVMKAPKLKHVTYAYDEPHPQRRVLFAERPVPRMAGTKAFTVPLAVSRF